jgi:hypothetical protein
MAIVNYGGSPNYLTGLSSDTKPATGVCPPNSRFYATDTHATYFYSPSSGWIAAYMGVESPTFNLPIYSNNTEAKLGGLLVGNMYRSGDDPDIVYIVH